MRSNILTNSSATQTSCLKNRFRCRILQHRIAIMFVSRRRLSLQAERLLHLVGNAPSKKGRLPLGLKMLTPSITSHALRWNKCWEMWNWRMKERKRRTGESAHPKGAEAEAQRLKSPLPRGKGWRILRKKTRIRSVEKDWHLLVRLYSRFWKGSTNKIRSSPAGKYLQRY